MNTNIEQIAPQPVRRHSSFGIAAFLVSWFPLCIMLGYLGYVYTYLSDLISWTINLPVTIIVVISSGCLLSLCAFILGVIALFQKNRKKVFAFLGIALSLMGFVLAILCFFSYFLFTGG
jgi:hypothetical protein